MPDPVVSIIPIQPLHPKLGKLVPFVAQRILDLASQVQPQFDPVVLTQAYLSRLYAGDATVAILAFVEDNGALVGHALAELQTDGIRRWVTVHQMKQDGNVGDAVQRALGELSSWGRAYGADVLEVVMSRDDQKWREKYGFTKVQYRVFRDLNDEGSAPPSE